MKDGLGPRVPIPNVSGSAERDGGAASAVDVSLRDPEGRTVVSARTDAHGLYVLAAPAGAWELRIKGKLPGDFDSIARDLVVAGSDARVSMGPMDIFAYGASIALPADSATFAPPTSDTPVNFRWRSPARSFSSGRVQLFDSAGTAVWYSPESADSSAIWNGTENQGVGAGSSVPTGTYTWRLKFELPDTSAARTASRRITFR